VVYVPRKKTKAVVDTPRPQIIFYWVDFKKRCFLKSVANV
jgi:hypothetical protein